MEINKKIVARIILSLVAISFFVCTWIFVGKEWIYILFGIITLAILLDWSFRNA